jgi:hypothetical protein
MSETRANPFFPASAFSNEDFPTFDRPMNASSGNVSSGHESRSGALHSKTADVIFIKAHNARLERWRPFIVMS